MTKSSIKWREQIQATVTYTVNKEIVFCTTALNTANVILHQYANDHAYMYKHTEAYFQKFSEGLTF